HILGCRFLFFSTLNISCLSLLAVKVSADKSADSLLGVSLYVTCCFSLSAFKILSLSLILDILIIVCLGVGLFGFILFGTFCASWIKTSVSFPRLGKFSAIISPNKLSASFSLFSV
uniref:Uncharacterized protein n=1 Tax=Equus caballus TaxID=9796 RepID=A0A9L0SPR2_HORSE